MADPPTEEKLYNAVRKMTYSETPGILPEMVLVPIPRKGRGTALLDVVKLWLKYFKRGYKN